MAGRYLNLETTPLGDSIIVSWTDYQHNKGALIGIIAGLIFIVFAVAALGEATGYGQFFFMLAFIGFVISQIKPLRAKVARQASKVTPNIAKPILRRMFIENIPIDNSVKFSKHSVEHRGKSFATSEVSRFEMGTKEQLTGVRVQKAVDDYNMIRMWIDDKFPYVVSKNTWQLQVNHEIRDALAKALISVQDRETEQKNEVEFGVVGDNGMPDY